MVFLLLGNHQHCAKEVVVQARGFPYKPSVVHYYVMNANLPLRIRLLLQRVSCVEIRSADLLKHEIYTASRVHAMAANQEGLVDFALLSSHSQCLHFIRIIII